MNTSSIRTNKGKNSISYYWINSQRYPCWIYDNGGYENVINNVSECIKNGEHIHLIRLRYNISPTTIKNFIKKHLPVSLIQLELQNRKKITSYNLSQSIKGKSKSTKGKTYQEIYGTSTPSCGFKRGENNPNFTRNKYVGCTLTNKSGNKFRSSYEVKLSDILESANIAYQYEHQYKLCNGKIKIVDFVINNKLVEVTGYAYEAWKIDFDAKIHLLKMSYPHLDIVIISTSENIAELKNKHSSIATIFDISDYNNIINYLQ